MPPSYMLAGYAPWQYPSSGPACPGCAAPHDALLRGAHALTGYRDEQVVHSGLAIARPGDCSACVHICEQIDTRTSSAPLPEDATVNVLIATQRHLRAD